MQFKFPNMAVQDDVHKSPANYLADSLLPLICIIIIFQ